MSARLCTQDGVVEIAQDTDDDTRPVDAAAALADEAATLRAISAAEEACIERIAAGLDRLGHDLATYEMAARYVRSRRWAVR